GRWPVLDCRPAIVGPGDSLVDLLGDSTHVVDEDPPRAGLHGEGERVAQAERPDRPGLAPRRLEERVVRRNGAVGVDPEQLALKRGHVLRRLAGGLVADGDVELAVLAEMDRPALVARGDRAAQLG